MPILPESNSHTVALAYPRCVRATLLTMALLVPCCAGLHAQNSGQQVRWGPPPSKPNDTSVPMTDASGIEDQRNIQMRNAARQESLVSSAEKLLRLANELHAEIAANHSATLTPMQIHKMEKIEKLAHKVRSEMAISLTDSAGGIMHIDSLGAH